MRKIVIILSIIGSLYYCSSSIASGETWRTTEGVRELLSADGEPIKTWTPKEWAAYKQEVESNVECMGRISACVDDIVNGNTSVEGPTRAAADGAQGAVESERVAGQSLPETQTLTLDNAAADAGSLPTVADGEIALGDAAPAAVALTVGLAIGNGLDELFHLPSLSELEESEQEKENKYDKEAEEASTAGAIGFSATPLPGMYYGHACDGLIFCGETEFDEQIARDIKNYPKVEQWPNTYIPAFESGGVILGYGLFCETTEELAPKCNGEKPEPCKSGASVPNEEQEPNIEQEEKSCLQPEGIPAPGLLTKEVEQNNVKAGLEPHPTLPPSKQVTLPTHPPTKVKEGDLKKIAEEGKARKTIEEHTKKAEQEEEEEKKGLIIPVPEVDELATNYKTRVEGAGFTDPAPEIYTVPEADSNPDTGPNDVATVSPNPGTRAAPETKVRIGANPEDAPTPGGPEKGGVPPVKTPGFHIPNFGVLCTGFPFGVPCWVVKTVQGWSATPSAPNIGTEEFTIKGKKIPAGKVSLASLEPIMEKVRPAMLIFATIGIVLLFYRFAKGGSPESGSGSDTVDEDS